MKARIDSAWKREDGAWNMVLSSKENIGEIYDEFNGVDVEVSIKKYRNKRSLDANAYCWKMIDMLAEKTGINKVEIYRNAIMEIPGVSATYCMLDEAVDLFREYWSGNGIGWITDTFKSKIKGCTNVIAYYGSSTYDSKQMSRLIDIIVQECKQQGIETLTPEEMARLKDLWE